MLCPTTTSREIQKILYRLQYIYDNGDATTIDRYTDLFIIALAKNKHKSIIETPEYKLNPIRQTLETKETAYYFRRQEFDLLYVFLSARGKSLHKEILINCVQSQKDEVISERSLWVAMSNINKKLRGSDLAIVRTGISQWELGKETGLKKEKVMPDIVEIDGKESAVYEVLEKYNIDYNTVYSRLAHGWTFEEAFKKPKYLGKRRAA